MLTLSPNMTATGFYGIGPGGIGTPNEKARLLLFPNLVPYLSMPFDWDMKGDLLDIDFFGLKFLFDILLSNVKFEFEPEGEVWAVGEKFGPLSLVGRLFLSLANVLFFLHYSYALSSFCLTASSKN